MPFTVKLTLTVGTVLVVTLVLVLWIGSLRQAGSTARLVEGVVRNAQAAQSQTVDFDLLVGLPPPVARFLRHVLEDRQSSIGLARLTQVGTLRTDAANERWLQFEATQVVSPGSVEFVWDAQVQVVPLAHVRVRDAYVAGRGSG